MTSSFSLRALNIWITVILNSPFDNFNIHNEYDIYCELEKENNHYYCQRTDSQKYLFTEDKHNDICICEDLANLKVLMQIPQIKDYFENILLPIEQRY